MNKTKLKIKRVLIANRSEIAKRIQNTCHAHGIETVAIYTQEDQKSPYVYSATKSYLLSQNGCAGYLQSDEIINIALRSNSDAIHPGYGFLSEDSTFAQKVIDAGTGADIITLAGVNDTEGESYYQLVTAAGDSTISAYDTVTGFDIADGTLQSDALDFDTATTTGAVRARSAPSHKRLA